MFTNCLKIFRHQVILLVCNVYRDPKYTILLILFVIAFLFCMVALEEVMGEILESGTLE